MKKFDKELFFTKQVPHIFGLELAILPALFEGPEWLIMILCSLGVITGLAYMIYRGISFFSKVKKDKKQVERKMFYDMKNETLNDLIQDLTVDVFGLIVSLAFGSDLYLIWLSLIVVQLITYFIQIPEELEPEDFEE